MDGCICSSCKNLKGILNEEGAIEQYECEYGFPSENCDNCSADDCNEVCARYIADEGQDTEVTINCSGCGKELKQSCDNNSEGEIYCVDCYLNKKF